jgi:transposase
VEIYGRVRRAVRVEGRSQRAVAREFGLSRETVRKMLQYAVPPGYQRQQPIKRPKLGPWLGVVDAILEDDKLRPAKQRHTAKRIFERLKEEHGFTGGYTIVKDYVRSAQLHSREMFIPLTHAPGEAQADFGEALVVIAGVEQKAHYLAVDLPHSDDCFVAAFPAETTEAFLEGHVRAFAYFGGVPTRTIGERFERDHRAMLPLPAAPYEACEKIAGRVSSLSLVRYRSNDYSVPTQYGHRQVWVKGYVHQVVIACGSEVIARHERSYERETVVFDPLHYLALLEQKTRALDQAAPLAGWQLPECFRQLRRLLEARLKKHGSREYVQVLRLMETFALAEVTHAIEDALLLGTISFDAVRHLLLCRIERRPPRLDMDNYPHLPMAQVRTTQAADYMTLLAEPCA